MMIALAQRPGLNAKQLGLRAGMSSRSGTFGTYLARLRSEGFLAGGRDAMRLTPAGMAHLGAYEPLPTGAGLQQYWLGELGGGAARMLEALIQAFPDALTKDALGGAAAISPKSGTFGTYLSRLRTLELISGTSALRASEELF